MKRFVLLTFAALCVATNTGANAQNAEEDADDNNSSEIYKRCFEKWDANGVPRRGAEATPGFYKLKCATECWFRERHMVYENGTINLYYVKQVYHKSMKTDRKKEYRYMIEFAMDTCYRETLPYDDGNCTMAYKFNECISNQFQVWDGIQYAKDCWRRWYERTHNPNYVEPTTQAIPLDHEPLYRPNTCDDASSPSQCLDLYYWQFCSQGEYMVDNLAYVYNEGEYFLNDLTIQDTYFGSLRDCYSKSKNLDDALQHKRNFTLKVCIYTEFQKVY